MCNYLMRGLGPALARGNEYRVVASKFNRYSGDSGRVLNHCRRDRVAHRARHSQRGNMYIISRRFSRDSERRSSFPLFDIT